MSTCSYRCQLSVVQHGICQSILLAHSGSSSFYFIHSGLDTFILFSQRTDIRRISLDVDVLVDVTLPLVNLTGAVALDWDSSTNLIYWSDVLQNTINVASIDVSWICLHICVLWTNDQLAHFKPI